MAARTPRDLTCLLDDGFVVGADRRRGPLFWRLGCLGCLGCLGWCGGRVCEGRGGARGGAGGAASHQQRELVLDLKRGERDDVPLHEQPEGFRDQVGLELGVLLRRLDHVSVDGEADARGDELVLEQLAVCGGGRRGGKGHEHPNGGPEAPEGRGRSTWVGVVALLALLRLGDGLAVREVDVAVDGCGRSVADRRGMGGRRGRVSVGCGILRSGLADSWPVRPICSSPRHLQV